MREVANGKRQTANGKRQTANDSPRAAAGHWRVDDDSRPHAPMRDRQFRHHAGLLPKNLTFAMPNTAAMAGSSAALRCRRAVRVESVLIRQPCCYGLSGGG
ncbi:hypothetical protein QZM22_11515 [Burkholderia oklahomensis]|uniref:hypothetical protein n=1 Tax=Burkholderia oklahomensis TaxID=342113 RepID=UPI0026532216|nr:hypothetical protein [Burkholderia oklahomensis]MDN7673129.1 hypothetical protein [Burkholderia oklahomensis]